LSQSDTEVLGVYLPEMYGKVGYSRHNNIITADVGEWERVCGAVRQQESNRRGYRRTTQYIDIKILFIYSILQYRLTYRNH